jgi:hypothetical protein
LGKRVAGIRAGKEKPKPRRAAPRRKAVSPRKARKAQSVKRIPKRAAFKKRKSR